MSVLSDNKQKLIEFYQSKNDSEQKLLLTFGIVFAIFLLYSLYSSVSNGMTESQQKLQRQIELNSWAAEQIAIIKQSGKKTSSGSRGSMTQIINSSARKHGVTIARLQPQKTDLVKVGIEEVGFNRLMNWLAELNSRHGISAANIDLSKADASGIVKVRRLDLERG